MAQVDPPPRPRGANPRMALLVMAAWCGLLAAASGSYLATLPAGVAPGCDAACDSPRSRALLFGLYFAGPALFAALLVGLTVLWLAVGRGWTRSTTLAGSLAASPVLAVAAAAVAS